MTPILVLGSGQLGLMMAAAGARFGLQVDRLDDETEELLPGTSRLRLPARDFDLLANYPIITAEKEHLPDTELVNTLRSSTNWANHRVFEDLADRRREKRLLDRLDIPTAPWLALEQEADIARARDNLSKQIVIKIARGGYDGRGQWRLGPGDEDRLPREHLGNLIAEDRIAFEREVSLVGARGRNGDTCFLPLVENVHHEGILRYTIAGKVNPFMQRQAETMLGRIMEDSGYTGVIAMECFEVDGGLLVNELAPRVHNSGHWSQLGTEHDQFDLHLRALLDLPLPEWETYRPTLMLNLIGCEFEPQWLVIPEIQCHWYGKQPRPGRKLGHINLHAGSQKELHDVARRLLPLLDETHRAFLATALERYGRQMSERQRRDK